jgi:endonuclease YncB( thermonuclease family)
MLPEAARQNSGSMRPDKFLPPDITQFQHRQIPTATGLVLTILVAVLIGRWASPDPCAGQWSSVVRRVDDGDTIVLAGGERVRYLGINAPEIAHDDELGEPYGREATAFNRSLVLGRRVKLELEEERRDHYGRLLAYVLLEDGTFINGELIRQGYAHVLRRQKGLRYWERLLKLQREALKEKRGMWSHPVVDPEDYYLGNNRSWVFHRPHCTFGLRISHRNRIEFKSRYEALYQGFSPGRRCKP